MKGNKNRLSNKYIKIVLVALLVIVSILSMYLVTNTNNKVFNAKIINQKADTREVVNIPDQDLKNFLLTYFKKPDNERKDSNNNYYLKLSNTSYIKPSDENEIYRDEMEKILELRAENINTKQTVLDLIGIETATNLTMLNLYKNKIENIEPIRGLTNLTVLSLDNNKIENIEPIRGLTHLTNLGLNTNKIDNIEILRGLTNLTYLGLDSNKIDNIEPLRELTNLTDLYLNSNKIENIEPIRGLTNLTYLSLYNNKIVNIDPLEDLINLYELDLEENKITNIEVLTGLTSLNKLNLEYNEIEDISPLDAFKTNKFSFLKIMHNRIKDLSSVIDLIRIDGAGYPDKLSFGDNIIKIEAPNTNRFNLPILKNSSGRVVDIEEREREYEFYRKKESISVENPESYKVSPSGLLKKNEDRNIFIYKKS